MAPETGPSEVAGAVEREDPFALAKTASQDELEKLKLAEDVFELRYRRRKRSTKLAVASQALVGYVAFAGLLVNAYQSYANSQKQIRQQQLDAERWAKEFERAKAADKYRAFFETSVLATDPGNPDKRLVGYALLQEFVEDKDYNSKATLMLEESLLQELRTDTSASGLDDAHRNAVVAILTSLAQTSDCHALERPARSISKVARHNQQTHDLEEMTEVFGVYVRRVIGRAALVCPKLQDFKTVRAPIRDTLLKVPEVGGLKGKITPADANLKVVRVLIERCLHEVTVSSSSDCHEVFQHYDKFCATEAKDVAEEAAACREVHDAVGSMAVQVEKPAPPPDPTP